MKCDLPLVARAVRKQVVGAVVGMTALGAVWGGAAYADPAQDTVAKLNELSRQAEELTNTMQSARTDLDRKLQVLGGADKRHGDDLAALEAAKAELAVHQRSVDALAAAVYMGGTNDSPRALLAAESPKNFIDKLVIQRMMAAKATDEIQSVRRVTDEAQDLEAASAKSAADAKAAVDAAVALRNDIQHKQSELRTQVAAFNADYAMLPQSQRAVLASALPASVVAELGLAAPIPTVGMGGLVPDARALAAYIMAAYPGVQSIGGVRADPIPDHPSGHAIDIMIGSDMSLGDAINADVHSQSARFNVRYTMWRVPSHFNHVHVTVD